MKLGLFYQSGHRLEACYHAIRQFRKFYPEAPIAFYEDNTDIMEPIARKFNFKYQKTSIKGRNDPQSGRPAFGVETMKGWLDRIYESCLTTLSEVDWVMNFEDDVWFRRELRGEPPYDLSGISGRGWSEDLYKYLATDVRGSYGCGGSIFSKERFIEAYNKTKHINWQFIDNMAKDPKPSEWTDSAITFLFLYSNFSVGGWNELSQYTNGDLTCPPCAFGWDGNLEELEKKQTDAAVIHCWKPFYSPTEQQKYNVKQELKDYV